MIGIFFSRNLVQDYPVITQKICSSMSFKALTSLNSNLLKSMKVRLVLKPAQSLAGIRHRCPVLLKDPKCKALLRMLWMSRA